MNEDEEKDKNELYHKIWSMAKSMGRQEDIDLINNIASPYECIRINEEVVKCIPKNKKDKIFYKVKNKELDEEEYKQYSDKKILNEKLNKILVEKKIEKRSKI